jgi:hypothetical protein
MLLIVPGLSAAQTPVDDDGNVLGSYEPQNNERAVTAGNDAALLSADALQELVGPVALYPDDLLAIVLPASAYPLQIAAAARFLEALESDASLKPDPDWDDAVVALTNYPEVIELMNDDLDWTYRLGEAVIAQQTDVVTAVESFRDRAYLAGNLKSDEYQTVSQDDGVIEISPVADDVIYVPYYEPRRVLVYQPRPVYYYHPHAYPVYYYPYAANHHFNRGYFWGVTTAFSIGWFTDSLHVYHHSYYGHPYYGHHYRHHNYWYRRPSISVYNTSYVNNTRYVNNRDVYGNRYTRGDRWQARDNRRELVRREGYTRSGQRNQVLTGSIRQQRDPIRFRERDSRPAVLARNERRQEAGLRDQSRRTGNAFTFRDRSEDRDVRRSSTNTTARRHSEQASRAQTPSSSRRDVASNTRTIQPKRSGARRQEQPPRASQSGRRESSGTSARRSSPPKRSEPRRQEQPPRASQPVRRESSGSSSSRSSPPKQKRESRPSSNRRHSK